jgi:hypothetical protein
MNADTSRAWRPGPTARPGLSQIAHKAKRWMRGVAQVPVSNLPRDDGG